ncbi:acetyl-CoA carboxylase biotin carboxyl carrier protein [bacterium]|nr:acetyl-CoA carboxylase biotin carboxyl carrier protein [bacterium]
MKTKKIKELIRLVENSDIGELEVTFWGFRRVCIRKNSNLSSLSSDSLEQIVEQITLPEGGRATTSIAPSAEPAAPLYAEIKAPLVGTFYRAPAPTEPPFVEAGNRVSVGQVVCIVEAMKVMNEIKSEINGIVREILVENAQPVEHGQLLFRIEPG